jgi:hypothetical protein
MSTDALTRTETAPIKSGVEVTDCNVAACKETEPIHDKPKKQQDTQGNFENVS